MRRQGSLEKTIELGKIEGSRETGRPNMRQIDSMKEAIGVSPQELSRAVKNRTLWTSVMRWVVRSQKRLNSTLTTTSPHGTWAVLYFLFNFLAWEWTQPHLTTSSDKIDQYKSIYLHSDCWHKNSQRSISHKWDKGRIHINPTSGSCERHNHICSLFKILSYLFK